MIIWCVQLELIKVFIRQQNSYYFRFTSSLYDIEMQQSSVDHQGTSFSVRLLTNRKWSFSTINSTVFSILSYNVNTLGTETKKIHILLPDWHLIFSFPRWKVCMSTDFTTFMTFFTINFLILGAVRSGDTGNGIWSWPNCLIYWSHFNS